MGIFNDYLQKCLEIVILVQPSQDNCRFITPSEVPRALDDIDNLGQATGARINLGTTNQNFITASVAVAIANFSFIFAAYTNNNGEHFVTGVRDTVTVYIIMNTE